jgi:hypothetical protein
LLVAGVLRKRSWGEVQDHLESIQIGKQKCEQLLVALLKAIRGSTEEELTTASKRYFEHYTRYESPKQLTSAKVTGDGTFLVHYAKRLGREVWVPSNSLDHVVVLAPDGQKTVSGKL